MEVIIIEDNDFWNKKIASVVKEFSENNNISLNIVAERKYNKRVESDIFDDTVKIFILDIKLPQISGYEIGNLIRYEKEDWKSIIIFVSSHNYNEEIISARLSVLTYISKEKKLDDDLTNALAVSLNGILKRKILEIKDGKKTYKIFLKNVLYIEKEKNSKYCKVVTINRVFRVRTSLKSLKEKTDFEQIKKHLLINQENVINRNNEKIIFIDHNKKVIDQ